MKLDYLRLTFRNDGDGTGELHAEISCDGFAGHGFAWLSISRLEEFAASLLSYPLPDGGLPPLRGGYWSKERRAELEHLHVSLSFYPIGLRGIVGCKADLRAPIKRHQPDSGYSSVTVELRTSYQNLAEFSAALGRLARDEAREAVLLGNAAD